MDFRGRHANDSDDVAREYEERGFKFPLIDRHHQLVPRLQHARPGGRRRRHAGAAGEATASCARRSRSPSTGRRATAHLPAARAARPRMGPLPPGLFGSRHGTREGVNPVTHKVERRQGRAPPDRRREAAARRGRLSRRPRRARPAGRWCSTTTSSARRRPSARPRSTGWSSSSPRSASSSRCAPPTTTSSRTRCARASTRSSGSAGSPTTRTPRTSCSCSTGRTPSRRRRREHLELREPRVRQAVPRSCRLLDDGPQKQAVIDQMVRIVQQDAPWSFGYFP